MQDACAVVCLACLTSPGASTKTKTQANTQPSLLTNVALKGLARAKSFPVMENYVVNLFSEVSILLYERMLSLILILFC